MATTISGDTGIDKVADGADMPAGTTIRSGTAKHTTYVATTSSSYVLAYTFTVTGVTAGNTLNMTYSVCDLVENAGNVRFRVLDADSNVLVEWGRQTNGNGGWRGIIADAAFSDPSPVSGTNTYTLQFKCSAGQAYLNYTSDPYSSFLTWQEIKG